jgi:hypothetical protein
MHSYDIICLEHTELARTGIRAFLFK